MVDWWPRNLPLKVLIISAILLVVGNLYWHHSGIDHLLDWTLTASAEKENILVDQFEVGAFTFQIEGQQYLLKEAFSVSEIKHNKSLSILALLIIWIGMTGVLAYASFLKRYAFVFVAALYLLFINQLYVDEINLLGVSTWKWSSILLMIGLLVPAYYFHAFRETTSFAIRWVFIFLFSSIILALFQWNAPEFYLYFAGHGTFGFAILSVAFIFLISEEIIFLVLYSITRTKGGANNEKHLLIFSTVYLLYLILYWADKMGIVPGDWDYLNPYYLLLISTLVSFYTISYKQELFDSLTSVKIDIRWLLIVLIFTCYGYLLIGDVRGNDAVFDGLSLIVLYAHIAFGAIFLLYIIVNFITPLIQGLMVYKVAYKSQNMPYITSKLAGFVAVVAFYLYAEQIPLRRTQSASLSFFGDYYADTNPYLSQEYFEEATIFGWDNQYASLKLAQIAMQNEDTKEANYRFGRATQGHPSPYTYVGAASALQKSGEITRAISKLREGQAKYAHNAELLNNLALLLDQSGARQEAQEALAQAGKTEKWNQAVTVNQLALGVPIEYTDKDWNWQALTNWEACENNGSIAEQLSFLSDVLDEPMNLATITYLINSGWNGSRNVDDSLIQQISQQLQNNELSKNLRHAHAYNLIKNGQSNRGIAQWEQLIQFANSYEKGFFYNQLGKLYLKAHAPRLAFESFENARDFQNEEAPFGMAVAAMEMQQWETAKESWQLISLRDSSYTEIIGQINAIRDVPDKTSFAWLYYQLPDDLEFYDELTHQFPMEQIQLLWDKLFVYWSYRGHQNDFAILTDRIIDQLSDSQKNRYQYYQKVLSDPSSLTWSTLNQNAFDVWKLMTFLDTQDIDMESRYQLLLEAISINKYHPQLIIEYAKTAIEMGLYDYAESATLRLLDVISPVEYQQTERMLFDLRQEREDRLEDWSF
jgi:Tfp pilus assembly protein PilF